MMNFNAFPLSLPTHILSVSLLLLPRATPFRQAHSRSLVPLVLLARSPNAGTAAIFGWWEGRGQGGGNGKEKAKGGGKKLCQCKFFHSRFPFSLGLSFRAPLFFQEGSLLISLLQRRVLFAPATSAEQQKRRRRRREEEKEKHAKSRFRSQTFFFGFVAGVFLRPPQSR